MTKEEYIEKQKACDTLCDVTDELVEERNFMKCVTCPFCKEIVDAIVTKSTIACPKCEIIVER